jgi:CRISPR/Cas system-associated exonuclease Cas4 (RecB family)
MLKEVIEEIRKKMEEKRHLEYKQGIGITSLIYCPLKWEYRQKYPEIKTEAIEIDDGFTWELAVKEALKSKQNIEEEKVLLYKAEDFTIEGHLDVYIIPKKVGIELKHTKLTIVDFPVSVNMEDIIDANNPLSKKIPVSDHYLLQAKIELFILKQYYPDATLRLWIKTTLKGSNRKFKKVVFEKVISQPATEEEINNLIYRFKNDKTPRFPWECKYCPYKRICSYNQGIEEIKEIDLEI